jgi:hypothetical protein
LQYLAAWAVRRGYVMGRCGPRTGIEPFGRRAARVMEREPYRSAGRVFWAVDNGSSHRGAASVERPTGGHGGLIAVQTPVHSGWLDRVAVDVSVVERKVLTPDEFAGSDEAEERLRPCEGLTDGEPRPFRWKFARTKWAALLRRLEAKRAATGVA